MAIEGAPEQRDLNPDAWDGVERRSEMRMPATAAPLEWVRYLLPWLAEPIASIAVLGHPAQNAGDQAAVAEVLSRARAALATRSVYAAEDPRVDVRDDALRAIADRDDVQLAFAPHRWEPAHVDLRKVLSVQPILRLSGLGERVASLSMDGLVDVCVPRRETQQVAVSPDTDGRGVTFTSRNPNLRILGTSVGEVEPAPGQKHVAASVVVGGLQSYVQVAQYRDRFFLRDGYHRSVALLRRGVAVVPCIFIFARSLQELTPNGGLFADDVLFAERPPAVCDFLDPNVTLTTRRPGVRRVLRVRADDFNLQ